MFKSSIKKIAPIFAILIAINVIGSTTFAAPLKDVNQQIQNKQSLDIKATAYAPGPHDNGKWGNLTHMGTKVRPGVIAVDPKVIPLGTKLYIEFANGQGMYGVAEDTGGAIKGNRIDIAMETVADAEDFGIKDVKVYIIN